MNPSDRRQFLQATAGGIAAAAAASASVSASTAERIQVGCVGVGGRAGYLLRAFAAQPDVDLVAVADIDSRRLPEALEAVEELGGRRPEAHSDFRRLIDDASIDVLVVGTPDHWHAIPTILACQAGKDVYVEKPDGHNMEEGARMATAMRKHNRLIQLGTQSRTSEHFRTAMDYVAQGHLGTVLVAKAWESAQQGSIGRPPDSDVPEGVDYDMWLGPAPQRPFNIRRFHGNWRWFFDYGTGDLGNDGVHRLDIARWGLAVAAQSQGTSLASMPATISAQGGKWYFDDAQEWPDTLEIQFEFAGTGGGPGRLLTYEMRIWAPYPYFGENEGVVLFGDQGYIVMGNTHWRAYDPDGRVLAEDQGDNDGESHIRNFLDCVKSRAKPNADLKTVGHPSSLLCHAGNVAWRLGRQVHLDAKTETFVNFSETIEKRRPAPVPPGSEPDAGKYPPDKEANALRTRPEYRSPWQLPQV